MRQLRFIFIALITSLFVVNAVFWRKAIAVLLSGIHKVDKFVRGIRSWLLGIVSFIIATITTVFVSGSFLNRLVLAASCTIFSFNSTFCTPNLGVESDRAVAFESFNTESEGHRGITLKATNKIWIFKDAPGKDFKFTDKARREIERAVRNVDLQEYYLDTTGMSSMIGTVVVSDGSPPIFSPAFYDHSKHFDWEKFREGSDLLFKNQTKIKAILDPVTDANKSQHEGERARQLLGNTLHTLQDFYAHSNWVELGKSKFNEDLGREVICDGKGDAHTPPCSIPADPNKKDDGKPNGEPTAIQKEICTIFRDSGRVCRKEYDPGTLDPNLKKLTSGYFMGLVDCSAPIGKTRHGTVGCSNNGLQKDKPGSNGFAGSKGYEQAYQFAVEASVDYINQIVRPLEDEGKLEAIKALMGIYEDPCKTESNQNSEECKLKAGKSYGDPHIATFDGMRYSFQTVGEFILAKSNDGAFEVQTRQAPVKPSLSLNSAVAMKVGSTRIALYSKDFPDADISTPLRVNGNPTTIQGNKLDLPGDGEILKQGNAYVVNFSTGEKVVVSPISAGGNSYFNVSPFVYNRAGKYNGLLGNVNGNPNDDQRIRGKENSLDSKSTYGDVKQVLSFAGLRIPGALSGAEKLYFDQLYKEFGNSWRVKQEESLFDYPAGKTTKNYVDPAFPDKYLTLNMLSADQIQKAQNACTEANVTQDLMEGCIFDVGFSGFSEFARATAEVNGYVGIVNQLFPRLNIPTTGQVVDRVIDKIRPKICLPFIGCK